MMTRIFYLLNWSQVAHAQALLNVSGELFGMVIQLLFDAIFGSYWSN